MYVGKGERVSECEISLLNKIRKVVVDFVDLFQLTVC